MPKGKNKKVTGLMKNEFDGKIMREFLELRVETYSYSNDISDKDKEAKCTKKCVIKRKPKFQDYKNGL